jgi:hypothetical protein
MPPRIGPWDRLEEHDLRVDSAEAATADARAQLVLPSSQNCISSTLSARLQIVLVAGFHNWTRLTSRSERSRRLKEVKPEAFSQDCRSVFNNPGTDGSEGTIDREKTRGSSGLMPLSPVTKLPQCLPDPETHGGRKSRSRYAERDDRAIRKTPSHHHVAGMPERVGAKRQQRKCQEAKQGNPVRPTTHRFRVNHCSPARGSSVTLVSPGAMAPSEAPKEEVQGPWSLAGVARIQYPSHAQPGLSNSRLGIRSHLI